MVFNRILLKNEIDKIKNYIKNKLDISELIKGKNISGLNLSYAIIKDLNVPDFQDVNFSYAQIGEDRKYLDLTNKKVSNCNFKYVKFLGKVDMSRSSFINCNFFACQMPLIVMKNSDMLNSTFCNTIFRLGTNISKVKVSQQFIDQIMEMFEVV